MMNCTVYLYSCSAPPLRHGLQAVQSEAKLLYIYIYIHNVVLCYIRKCYAILQHSDHIKPHWATMLLCYMWWSATHMPHKSMEATESENNRAVADESERDNRSQE